MSKPHQRLIESTLAICIGDTPLQQRCRDLVEALESTQEQLEAARWQAEALGAHNFSGRHDRDCVLCGKPDRHPFHGTMMRPSNPASEPEAS